MARTQTQRPASLRKRITALVRSAMPWLSLAAGLVGAFIMNRAPERAWLVATCAVAAWGLLLVASALLLRSPKKLRGKKGAALRVLRFGSLALTQSLTQITVFFVLPWYLRASTWSAPHTAFCVALLACAALTLWDPVFEWVLGTRAVALPLLAIASFAGLNAVGPLLGLSHGYALHGSGIASFTACIAVAAWSVGPRRGRWPAALAAWLLGGFALFTFAPAAVPAAPLKLVSAAIGADLVGKSVTRPLDRMSTRPRQLVCATAIYAPLGLRDELLHVWRKDGLVFDTIPLEITGGRRRGFRTWSIKQNFGSDPAGRWSCTVETQTGQILGTRAVIVDPR